MNIVRAQEHHHQVPLELLTKFLPEENKVFETIAEVKDDLTIVIEQILGNHFRFFSPNTEEDLSSVKQAIDGVLHYPKGQFSIKLIHTGPTSSEEEIRARQEAINQLCGQPEYSHHSFGFMVDSYIGFTLRHFMRLHPDQEKNLEQAHRIYTERFHVLLRKSLERGLSDPVWHTNIKERYTFFQYIQESLNSLLFHFMAFMAIGENRIARNLQTLIRHAHCLLPVGEVHTADHGYEYIIITG